MVSIYPWHGNYRKDATIAYTVPSLTAGFTFWQTDAFSTDLRGGSFAIKTDATNVQVRLVKYQRGSQLVLGHVKLTGG